MKRLLSTSTTIFIIYLIFAFFISAGAKDRWENIMNKQGIKVYSMKVKGQSLNSFKGTGIINAGIDVIIEVLRDIPAGTEWVEDCIASKIVTKTLDSYTIYNAFKMPWPVSDRDVVIKSSPILNLKNGKFIFSIEAVGIDHSYRRQKNRVRMPRVYAKWTLEYISRNKTLTTYFANADPGGYIPAWISNLVSKKLPYKSITSLRKMVKKKKYITSAVTSELNEVINIYKAGDTKKLHLILKRYKIRVKKDSNKKTQKLKTQT